MQDTHLINIFGDICFTLDNKDVFQQENPLFCFHEVNKILQEGEINIANLEAPIKKTSFQPIQKTGPSLSNSESVLNLLSNAGFTLLNLANNHIRDFGSEGVDFTMSELKKRKIEHVGAGKNLIEANKPYFITIGPFKIAVISYAEHEFSPATDISSGANTFDIFNSFDDLHKIRKDCNFLLVLFHGGIEYYPFPSPLLQKKCRKMVSSGADLVICQHSHCIGAKEEYKNGLIVYGQGNSLFGYRQKDNNWNTGLLIQLKLNQNISYHFIPICAQKNGGIDLLSGQNKDKCLDDFYQRSSYIAEQNNIMTEWKKFCLSKKNLYLPMLFGLNRYLTRINRICNNALIDSIYSKRSKMIAHNLLQCESHLEVIQTILEDSY